MAISINTSWSSRGIWELQISVADLRLRNRILPCRLTGGYASAILQSAIRNLQFFRPSHPPSMYNGSDRDAQGLGCAVEESLSPTCERCLARWVSSFIAPRGTN